MTDHSASVFQDAPISADRAPERLKVLSYNIQVGIETRRFRDYFVNSWRHFLPHKDREFNLNRIAELVSQYDLVALQEVDAGSVRSKFINQVEYLAEAGGFPHWHYQQNRRIGKFAAHSNGLLSRLPTNQVVSHKLPGLLPGRGALQASYGRGPQPLLVFVVHLALGVRGRQQQFAYLAEQIREADYAIVLGDMNCEAEELVNEFAAQGVPMQHVDVPTGTYPSWQPKTHIDHILLTPNLTIGEVEVLPMRYSDHLPIAVEVILPPALIAELQAGLDYDEWTDETRQHNTQF